MIDGCKTNDRHSQKHLYAIFAKKMYNTAFRITKCQDDAADVLQDSFVEIFGAISNFRSKAEVLEHWIRRIIINKALNVLRRKKHLNEIFIDPVGSWESISGTEDADSIDCGDAALLSQKISLIRDTIQEMHEGYRLVLTLYLWEGYDHQEIAEILKIQESTSRTQFMRGRQKLIQILKEKGIRYAQSI